MKYMRNIRNWNAAVGIKIVWTKCIYKILGLFSGAQIMTANFSDLAKLIA